MGPVILRRCWQLTEWLSTAEASGADLEQTLMLCAGRPASPMLQLEREWPVAKVEIKFLETSLDFARASTLSRVICSQSDMAFQLR